MKVLTFISAMVVAASSLTARAGETYKFDQARSRIEFTVHQYLGTTHGKFTKFEGQIDIDREHAEKSSVVAKIQVRSIGTGIEKRDEHLRGAEFFDVEKFPEITFKSRSVKQTGPESGDILGDFTMHGVTKPITLHVKLLTAAAEKKQTRWSVTTEPLKRQDVNLMFCSSAEGLSGISQTVAIIIEIEALRTE